MLKKLLNISILFALSSGIFAQADYSGETTRTPTGKALQKLRWDMNLGTAFTYMPGYGGGMSYYAAPGFSYPINNRFSFHGGMVAGVYTSPGIPNAEGAPEKVTSGYTIFYGTAAYHLNQNVVFYATGVKSIHSFGRMNPFFAPSYDEISFGSSIRLGNNVTIGASVHFREYSPMSGPNYSPFFE
ncbi:MAG: hypothetical protein ACP5E3_08080 [Bacteroidales bacterium]